VHHDAPLYAIAKDHYMYLRVTAGIHRGTEHRNLIYSTLYGTYAGSSLIESIPIARASMIIVLVVLDVCSGLTRPLASGPVRITVLPGLL
jgi:hypothetical protein